ncbi:metallophosphoesterase family protein [Lentilactobacillus parafarraginis]|uniref:Ser Thr phosphatase family protein n=1 Tax=Lentilactobacillus parafarraginis DSM 18390 = JCM 14109 TaxID=1423786 RepID=A0A0R1YUY9_9LACO|nr:DNA repair exonuclease [Lentilactobacillus parafarraginis]KRM43497.1 Ser Thr phosphatase family protein [Lentilactobacillus parafarraginis DSM 18390 = JCM 14109]
MKFVHAADLHLDSPFLGLQNDAIPVDLLDRVRQSTFQSFERIVDDAITNRVDFVLLAGDLFDRNDHSVAAEVFFLDQLNRLANQHIPVFLLFGNHDYFDGDVASLGYPKNTYVFPSNVATTKLETHQGERIAISGFSFNKRWVREAKIADYPEATGNGYHIGMLHGSLESLNSPDGNYAPFTLDQLEAKHYNYWALGHIHKRQSLDAGKTINYPGNPQGRHINEAGEKGYLMVHTENGQFHADFHATAPIVWRVITQKAGQQSTGKLAAQILRAVTDARFETLSFCRIQIIMDSTADATTTAQILSGELLETLQNQLATTWRQRNCWITSIKVDQAQTVQLSGIDQQYFDQASQQLFKGDQVKQMAGSLTHYPFIQRDFMAQDSLQDIYQRAKALLQENVSGEAQLGDHSED